MHWLFTPDVHCVWQRRASPVLHTADSLAPLTLSVASARRRRVNGQTLKMHNRLAFSSASVQLTGQEL